ncbi:MAG: histidine phosphatase family protein [Candidatus Competibacteraceae bacterium]|nr:histidine phosphatase family protein [Candidatus Competibacteraceae bacterium]
MNELTMDIGKRELFVKQEEGELLLRVRASTKNQQEFESDLNKLRNHLDRLENAKKLTFVFREALEIPGYFEDHFKKSGIDIEKKITKLQAITNQKIWLMRHGYPNPDSGVLTEEGIERVKKTAAFFKDKNIVIYCSPIARCVQTATILKNGVTGVEWHPMSWLGEFEGLPENWLSLLTGETIVMCLINRGCAR